MKLDLTTVLVTLINVVGAVLTAMFSSKAKKAEKKANEHADRAVVASRRPMASVPDPNDLEGVPDSEDGPSTT